MKNRKEQSKMYNNLSQLTHYRFELFKTEQILMNIFY